MIKFLLFILVPFAFSSGTQAASPQISDDRVVLHTNLGDVVMAFYPAVAPKHVAQILSMAKAGVYDGAQVFRVEKGFVAQVANSDARKIPLTEEQKATVHKLNAEFSEIKHRRYILSMARYDDPNSAEASFSIVLGDAPHLDGHYTVFGEIVGGQDVVGAIENVPVNGFAPVTEITIDRAEAVTAADVAKMQLRGPRQPYAMSDQQREIFIICAGLMFIGTVTTPLIRNWKNTP